MSDLISIDVDLKPLQRWTADQIARQIPFATAKALTLIAQEIQTLERARLREVFKLRSEWTARGIRVVRAEKRDYPAVQAIVGSRDEYLVLQETGGRKTPAAGKRLAIPAKIPAARRGSLGVPKSIRPRALLSGKRGFISPEENLLVRERVKGARFVGPVRPAAPYFFLRPSAEIRPVLGFRETALEYARGAYDRIFAKELQAALSKGVPRR